MFSRALLVSIAATTTVAALSTEYTQTAEMTPHDQYSSSIGVLGCKLRNTNRVAYWPLGVDCDNLCVEVSHEGRSVHLLKIDQSGGAHDISYDAWNYLVFGKTSKEQPMQGGAVTMEYKFVHMDHCKDLLLDGKLALSAPNSMNYISSCIDHKQSWVANNYKLINIFDPICHYGWNEECTLDLTVSNQPKCPHTLGDQNHRPAGLAVTNIKYGTGIEVNS